MCSLLHRKRLYSTIFKPKAIALPRAIFFAQTLMSRPMFARFRFQTAPSPLICANHVFEHVTDDHTALRELRRVTAPQGRAGLQTPVSWDQEDTDEDATAPEAERIQRFGQRDHVRRYGRSILSRFQDAGWTVRTMPVNERYSLEDKKSTDLNVTKSFSIFPRNTKRPSWSFCVCFNPQTRIH